MVTLNQLVYDLLEIIRPNLSDDDSFDKRQIAFWIKNQRALWLRNELNKNRTVDPNIVQDLGCIELELADKADCCELSDGCKILRTNVEIPNTIELHNKTGITRVAPIDKLSVPFSFVSYERAIWSGNGKYNKNHVFAFILNNRIYVISKDQQIAKYMTHINVRGIFEDPEQAARFKHCSGEPCYSTNSNYPVNSWMIDYMKDAIIKLNFATALKVPTDNSNNAKDDAVNEAQ